MPDPFSTTSAADPYPTQGPDETLIDYWARVRDWYLRNPGVVASPAASDPFGIPAPVPQFAAPGPRLGAFVLAGNANLPQPTYAPATQAPPPARSSRPTPPPGNATTMPVYPPPGAPPSAPLPLYPVYPAPAAPPVPYYSPGGSVAPGLRLPFDDEALGPNRAPILAATHFDTAWGVPPDMPGLRWDPSRYIYAPTLDQAGTPYGIQASSFKFRQAYQDPSLGQGNWGVRWVSVQTTRPDPSRPYRILGPGEASAADVAVQQYLAGRQSGPGQASAGTGGSKAVIVSGFLTGTFPAPGLPPGVSMVPRKFRMADYAWLTQKDLPLECPYPYGAMPVPQADYASGRWLDPDYVPSIPLPPPYDQIPWQCGIPAGPAKKKWGGGPPDGTPGSQGGASLSQIVPGAGDGEGAASVSLNVGIPNPTGNIFASEAAVAAGDLVPVDVLDPLQKTRRGLIVGCDIPPDLKVPALIKKARGKKRSPHGPKDCEEALRMFLAELASALHQVIDRLSRTGLPDDKALADFLRGLKITSSPISSAADAPAWEVQLLNRQTLLPAKPQDVPANHPEVASLLGMLNGTQDAASDGRAAPGGPTQRTSTRVVLVNDNWSGDSANPSVSGINDLQDPPDGEIPRTANYTDAGPTPGQVLGSGIVFWNVEARADFADSFASWAADRVIAGSNVPPLGYMNPMNALLALHHEMQYQASAESVRGSDPAMDALGTAAEQRLAIELGSPVYEEGFLSDGAHLVGHEMPGFLFSKYWDPRGGEPMTVSVPLDADGGILRDAEGKPSLSIVPGLGGHIYGGA